MGFSSAVATVGLPVAGVAQRAAEGLWLSVLVN